MAEPAFGDRQERAWVEVVVLAATDPSCVHESNFFEHAEVLADSLARKAEAVLHCHACDK